jgi:hypothetical protein
MSRIRQINLALHGIQPFSKRLKEKYGFVDYYSQDEPCFFWGCLGESHKINNHRGLKVVKFLTPADCWVVDELEESENLYIISDPFIKTNKNFKFANIEFEIGDYSFFNPIVLGDKIYCYMRDATEFRRDITESIQRKINYEIIYGGLVGNADYYDTLQNLKSQYYDKCFLSLNLSSKHGYTTVKELGYMGIKTIMHSPYNFPSVIQLKKYSRDWGGHMGGTIIIDEDEIVEKINNESKYIGTMGIKMNPHNINDEWVNVDFWTSGDYTKY